MSRARKAKTAKNTKRGRAKKTPDKPTPVWQVGRSPLDGLDVSAVTRQAFESEMARLLEADGPEKLDELKRALSVDPFARRPRGEPTPAPLGPNSVLATGYSVNAEALRRALAPILSVTYETLNTFFGRLAPLEHQAKLATKLIELSDWLAADIEKKRSMARHAVALEELAQVYEEALQSWPETPGQPPDPRVPENPSPAEASALEAQERALVAWAERVAALGLQLPSHTPQMLRKHRANGVFIRAEGGPVKIAAATLEALLGLSARTLQEERRRMPVVEANRLLSPGLQSTDPSDVAAVGAFASDVFAGRDPLIARHQRAAAAEAATQRPGPVGRLLPRSGDVTESDESISSRIGIPRVFGGSDDSSPSE